jgi:phage major head subunit gpT-like protein
MAPNLRSSFSDILAPDLFDVIVDSYKESPKVYSSLFKVQSSNKRQEFSTTIEGVGPAPVKNEGAEINFADPKQGFDYAYTHEYFAQGISISHELYSDDLHGVMKKAGEMLGRSIRAREELTAFKVFNDGFNPSASGGDGVELFSTAHPFASGGTGRNELSTPADLSQSSLTQCLIDLATTETGAGIKMAMTPRILLVPEKEKFNAQVILGSTQKTGSDFNDINPMQENRTGLQIISSPYLEDDDAFFVLTDEHDLNFFVRMAPKMENDDEFKTGNMLFKVTASYSAGFSNWLGVFGSPGA